MKNILYLILALSLLLAACSGGSAAAKLKFSAAPNSGQQAAPAETSNSEEASEPPAEKMEAGASLVTTDLSSLVKILGNLSYTGIFPSHPITLKDGYYAYSEGGVGTPHVSLVERMIQTGDLNADGVQDAIFMLEDDSEGSGRLTFLVAVLNVLSDPLPLEAAILGGRSGVKSLAMDGSQIIADIVTHGPGDPDCCPSWNVQLIYSLEDSRLVEKSRRQGKQISLADLNGTQWRLAAPGANQETVLPEGGITLQFDNSLDSGNGQVSGFTGCNDYTGKISSGDSGRNSIKVASLMPTTQKSCLEQDISQEKVYLEALANAYAWVYAYGNLGLIFSLGNNKIDQLLFEPVEK